MAGFSSATYWDTRYRAGGTSGAGSAGHLARYKAEVLNGLIAANGIASMIDLGCGDASQLALLKPPPDYVGVDVSPMALARCAARHPSLRFATPDALAALPPAELTVALDVLYHLVEDDVFARAIQTLFGRATRFVAIYASNADIGFTSPHVRHRCFTDRVAADWPDWRLLAHLPNPWPYHPARPDETSFSDFYIYGKSGEDCVVKVPALF